MALDATDPKRWLPREKRICRCDYEEVKEPHLVTRAAWYRHRRRELWHEQQDIQEEIIPVDLDDNEPDGSTMQESNAESQDNDISQTLESINEFEDVDHEIPDDDSDGDDDDDDDNDDINDEQDSSLPDYQPIQQPMDLTPEFIDTGPADITPNLNSRRMVYRRVHIQVNASQEQQQTVSSDPPPERPESVVAESVISDSENTLSFHQESHFQPDDTVSPEQTKKHRERRSTKVRENNLVDPNTIHITPTATLHVNEGDGSDDSSSSDSSQSTIHKFVDPNIDDDDSQNSEGWESPNYVNPYLEDDDGTAPGPEDLYDSDSDEDMEDSEDESHSVIEDFSYNIVPNVVIEPEISRHLMLMKVRMDGNVANDIHKRYLHAVQYLYGISIANERTAKRELGAITDINHVRYDICRNNCICYAAYPTATSCHICQAERLDRTDPNYVEATISYKRSFSKEHMEKEIPGDDANSYKYINDYWNGSLFSTVKNGRGIWTDDRDVGFIFSADGFSLFKIGHYDIWPIILINCNLPPSERILKKNIIMCGIIPGPNGPKDISSFLKPMIDEFVQLQEGTKAWDGLRKEWFILRAHIALVTGDTPAMAKLMKWTGPNSYRYCRFCAIYGISEGHIYCPLEPPRDRDEGRTRTYRKSMYFPERQWDAKNLPIWTDAQLRENHKTVENEMDYQWGKLMGTNGEPIFSCLKSVVYPWTFAPDIMHLLDENTPRLYLAQWMGVFHDKEQTLLITGENHRTQNSQLNIDTLQESQARSEVNSQANTQGDSQTHNRGERRKRRRGLSGVSFNDEIEVEEDPFILPKRAWDKIGEEIANSKTLIPTAFGKAFRDIKYHASYKASELMNFMHLISPIVLYKRLPDEHYDHWHHFVLATEKARRYKLSPDDIEEMERDMVQVMTDYERLYYQYKVSKIRSCTTQVHGLLHLATAMRVCGPCPIYHQYPMERICGIIKSMCHSRSASNRNISLQMLERERLRYLPLVAIVPHALNEATDKHLFGLDDKDKVGYPQYPDCLLMRPKASRKLNRFERNSLREFHADTIGVGLRSPEMTAVSSVFTEAFDIWGRAVAGRVLSDPNDYEVIGSAMSNAKMGVFSSRRNNSWVRYILTENDQETSYFGKVHYYLPYEIRNEEDPQDTESFMLAYIERVDVGRVKKLKLAYTMSRTKVFKEYVDVSDIQELIGCIKSRGRDFLVSRTSCFWPKKGFNWKESIDREDLF